VSTWTILLDARRFIVVGQGPGGDEGVYYSSYHGPVAVLLSTLGVSLSVDTLITVESVESGQLRALPLCRVVI
jgi:hypothetical protein